MRALSVGNLLDKKYKVFEFDGLYQKAFGNPERNGCWLIYGKEKNGKTWFALLLAQLLSKFEKVLYVSAEEGTGLAFQESVKRAQLPDRNSALGFVEYTGLHELRDKIKSRKAAKVIVIDNCTVYVDELRANDLRKLLLEFEDKLFVFLAHEEKKRALHCTR